MTRIGTCTVQMASGRFCDAPGAEDMPFPICLRHALALYRRVFQSIDEKTSDPLYQLHFVTRLMGEERERNQRKWAEKEYRVYYVHVGDLIKIGVTTTLKQRMSQYPPGSRLLASEVGGYALEAERHKQFADLLAAGKEWFHPGAALISHITALQEAANVA